jgi:hypothetical protein
VKQYEIKGSSSNGRARSLRMPCLIVRLLRPHEIRGLFLQKLLESIRIKVKEIAEKLVGRLGLHAVRELGEVRFAVAITWAPAFTAAATTCRSFGSFALASTRRSGVTKALRSSEIANDADQVAVATVRAVAVTPCSVPEVDRRRLGSPR